MGTDCANGRRRLQGLMIGMVVVLMATLGISQIAEGQSPRTEFCKKIEPKGGGILDTRECGTKFVSTDAYVAIVIYLGRVNDSIDVAFELLDPDQTTVWTVSDTIRLEAGYYYPNWRTWRLLAVAADAAVLAAENIALPAGMIKVEGKPVKERLGEWTVRIRLRRAPPLFYKFTLQAAP